LFELLQKKKKMNMSGIFYWKVVNAMSTILLLL
jgi:hypothetical protein